MARYIFVTGGVVSSLGKGLSSASLAYLLQSRGFKVRIRKLDPYLNVDPGTMSPFQHGEVYVTDDGAETDLDLGHYERFSGVSAKKSDNITTGKIYNDVLKKERKGEYLGKTVQVIPHITDRIKQFIKNDSSKEDFVICEIGGIVGDIESLPFEINSGVGLVFIVGMPRSGTTLVEQIISSHKNVYGAGELNFLTDAINKFILKDNEFLNKNINEVEYENLYNIVRSLFENVRVADFLIEKDRLFAEVTLSNEEMNLYDKVYEHITLDAPTPDLVIYLQAPIEVLKERINKRGNINEQYLTLDYLERLNDAYSRFFLDYKDAPLLIINAADINLESNERDYETLITMIMSNPKGKNFVNPQPSII